MKKLIIALLVLPLILSGCTSSQDVEARSSLTEAIRVTNAETKVSGKYMLEITFEGATLYYALGDVAWDLEAQTASVVFSQTYLGDSSEAANYFANGKIVSVDDGESISVEREPGELFSKFPYAKIPALPEDATLDIKNSTAGTAYGFAYSDTSDISRSVVGDDIYKMVDVLKKPQPEKTRYSETACTLTVKDGRVVGCRYEFDITLFDTPAYIPGYSVPEEDYTLDLHVIAKMAYESFGDKVTVQEYSGDAE